MMNRMKIIPLCLIVLSFSSCTYNENEANKEHTHSYIWKYDEEYHYQLCEECGDETNKSLHNFKDYYEDDVLYGKKCQECGYFIKRGEIVLNKMSFALLEDGTYSLVKVSTSFNGVLSIPDKLLETPVTSIGKNAINQCHNINKIIVPNSILKIDETAIIFNNGLSEILLNEGLETIGNNALSTNRLLETITIPASTTYIHPTAFNLCTKLESIDIDKNNKIYESIDGVVYSKDLKSLLIYPCAKNSGEAYFINEGIERINEYSFVNSQINKIVAPSTLLTIDKYAFCETYINEVILNEGLLTIEDFAFYDNNLIRFINIPSTVKKVGKGTWNISNINLSDGNPYFVQEDSTIYSADYKIIYVNTDYELTSITLKESVEVIAYGAFQNHYNLEYISFNNSLKTIGEYVFKNCSSIKELNLPNSLLAIGAYAFENNTGLERLNLSNQLVSIRKNAFQINGSIDEIVLPKSLKEIADYAFWLLMVSNMKYDGTIEEFNNIILGEKWCDKTVTMIDCADGSINL